jgi:hypothetical protein
MATWPRIDDEMRWRHDTARHWRRRIRVSTTGEAKPVQPAPILAADDRGRQSDTQPL